jgi:hypothetical protein
MPIELDTNPYTFKQYLQHFNKLRIPDFQREYIWTVNEHVDRLWNDINDYMGERDSFNYFIGSSIVYRGRNENAYTVVDGQQRLVTLSVLVCAIRDHLERLGEESGFIDNINRDMIYSNEFDINDRDARNRGYDFNKVKLKTIPYDRDPFRWATLPVSHKDRSEPRRYGRSFRRIVSCYKYFEKNFSAYFFDEENGIDMPTQERIELLHKWYQTITNKLSFVITEVDELEHAYIVFETINATGSPLTVADLTKNLIISRAGDDNRSHIASQWDIIKNNVVENANDKIHNFLRSFWLATRRKKPMKYLYHDIKTEINRSYRDQSTLRSFVEEIVEYSNYYLKIKNPNQDVPSYQDIEDLGEMGVRQHFPLLLSMLKAHDMGTINAHDFKNVLRILESLFVKFYVIHQGSPSVLEDYFSKWAIDLQGEGSEYIERMRKDAIRLCNDIDYEGEIKELRIEKNNQARFILKKIRIEITGTELRVDDPQSVNLEHILPQNPHREWLEVFENGAEMKKYRYWLGNLTLLDSPMNKRIRNRGFPMKKEQAYSLSSIEMTSDLCVHEHWDSDLIKARQKELVKVMKNMFVFS